MSRLRRRHRRYALPSDVRSTDEMRTNVALAIALAAIVAGLAFAHIILASCVWPFSAFMVVSQP